MGLIEYKLMRAGRRPNANAVAGCKLFDGSCRVGHNEPKPHIFMESQVFVCVYHIFTSVIHVPKYTYKQYKHVIHASMCVTSVCVARKQQSVYVNQNKPASNMSEKGFTFRYIHNPFYYIGWSTISSLKIINKTHTFRNN